MLAAQHEPVTQGRKGFSRRSLAPLDFFEENPCGDLEVDARLVLETDDKHQIYMAWKGLRHGPKEVMDRLYRGEIVDPGAYYFRTTPYFETSSENYGWINRICSIARGSLSANTRTLDIFQVL